MNSVGGPTQRAANKWESARFSGIFHASAESCFQALPASRPLAANASRWAAQKAFKNFSSEKKVPSAPVLHFQALVF